MEEQYKEACQLMASPLMAAGFMPEHNAQIWRKISPDNDMVYEVFFQPNLNQQTQQLEVIPHLFVLSHKVLAWMKENAPTADPSGMVWGAQLGFLSEERAYRAWSLTDKEQDTSIDQIIAILSHSVLPIVDLFDDNGQAVNILSENGGELMGHLETSLSALIYMLVYGDKQHAESYFNHAVGKCPQKEQIVDMYAMLPRLKSIDPSQIEFHGANHVKIAYINGLELKQ